MTPFFHTATERQTAYPGASVIPFNRLRLFGGAPNKETA